MVVHYVQPPTDLEKSDQARLDRLTFRQKIEALRALDPECIDALEFIAGDALRIRWEAQRSTVKKGWA